jgi:hypothetical protein
MTDGENVGLPRSGQGGRRDGAAVNPGGCSSRKFSPPSNKNVRKGDQSGKETGQA